MAITISGTDGIVGAGFTVDASGVSVTAGVGTFSSLNAAASGLTGALPALSAASLTSIPAANIVGLATAGFERSGGFSNISVSRTTEAGALSGATNYDFTLPSNCYRVDFVGHNISTSGSGTPAFRVATSAGVLSSGNYTWGEDGTSTEYESSQNQMDMFDTNMNASSDTGDIYMSFLSSSASNFWIFQGQCGRRTQSGNMYVIGIIDLGGNALTSIRFFPFGTGFDTGRFSWTSYATA